MVFFDRRRRGPDRWLTWKMAALGAGGVLAVLGIRFEQSWLIWCAALVLFAGWVLRFGRE